jgi:hypothetical protein
MFISVDLGFEVGENAEGATIYVPTDYTTIQEAIDAASDGDTVFVSDGNYNEYIYINKSINLSGQSREGVNINGGVDWVLKVNNCNIIISQISVIAKTVSSVSGRIAIISDFSNITLQNCEIIGGSVSSGVGHGGKGVYSIYSNVIIINSSISGGETTGDKGGEGFYSNNSTVKIFNSIIKGGAQVGSDGNGGEGIYSRWSEIEIHDSIISGEYTISFREDSAGDGIFSQYSNIDIINCNISGGCGIWYRFPYNQPPYPPPIDPFGGNGIDSSYSTITIINSTLFGGNGFDGPDGYDDYYPGPYGFGEDGYPGNFGGNGISAEKSNLNLDGVYIAGGIGGNGGDGGNSPGRNDPSVGGNGGIGGNGGNGIYTSCSNISINRAVIEGGEAGTGGNGGDAFGIYHSFGGSGGKGGNAGHAIYFTQSEGKITRSSLIGHIGGQGGNGASGERGWGRPGDGGDGGNGIHLKCTELDFINSSLISGEAGSGGLWCDGTEEHPGYGPYKGEDGTVYCHTSYLVFVNSSWTGGKSNDPVIIGDPSSITVQWYLNVHVINLYGIPLQNAIVRVRDKCNINWYWKYPTNKDGYVKWIVTTQYIKRSNNIIYYTPHNVSAIYYNETEYVNPQPNMKSNKEVTIIMKDYSLIISLKSGWNLISIPSAQSPMLLESVLDPIKGKYDSVQWYDPTDLTDHWKHHHTKKRPHMNDLHEINHNMGIWVHLTINYDTYLPLTWEKPTSNRQLLLKQGWNLVGYPASTNRLRNDALNNLEFDLDCDSIWTFNAITQKWVELGETDYFELGKGYWIHIKEDCDWLVFSPILNLDKNRYYPTIQDAINKADPHETIEISPGTYNEELTISKLITLQGKNNQTTIIKGNIDPVITIMADDVTINNLNLSGGRYGIDIQDSQNVHINNNIIVEFGLSGINAINSSLHIQNNHISNDPQRTGGFGMKLTKCKEVIIENNTVEDIVYSLYLMYSSGLIQNNIISPTDGYDDRQDSIGIALYLYSNTTVIHNSVIGGDVGIGIEFESCPYIYENKVMNSEYYGIFSRCGKSINIINNTLTNSEVLLRDSSIINLELISGYATLINSTMSNYEVKNDAELIVKWYMDVRVVNHKGYPIYGVRVIVRNNFGHVIGGNYYTDIDGYVRHILITELWESNSGRIFFTPHNVTAVLGSHEEYANPEPWMSENKEVVIMVDHGGG